MKRNQKGFTLIELLAVIVILAIIALIATPMVLKYINESKKGAAESDCYAAMNAAELAYAKEQLDQSATSIFTESNGKLTVNVSALDVKNKANFADGATIELSEVTSGEYSANVPTAGITVRDFTCKPDGSKVNCE